VVWDYLKAEGKMTSSRQAWLRVAFIFGGTGLGLCVVQFPTIERRLTNPAVASAFGSLPYAPAFTACHDIYVEGRGEAHPFPTHMVTRGTNLCGCRGDMGALAGSVALNVGSIRLRKVMPDLLARPLGRALS
jgi:hypothetical protein